MTDSYGKMTSFDDLHFHSSPEKLSLKGRQVYENLFHFEHKKTKRANQTLK